MKTIKKLISLSLTAICFLSIFTSIATSASAATTYTIGNYVINEPSGVNLRKGAGTSYSKITAIPNKKEITVTAIKGSWGKTTYNGKEGWVCLDYAKRIPDNSKTVKTGEYIVSEKSGLNIRVKPGTSYKKVGAIPYNTVVNVTSVKNNWGYVKYKKVSGWICLDYAKSTSTKKVSSTSNTQKNKETLKFVNSLSSKYKTNITTQKWAAYYSGNGYHLGVDLGTSGNKSTTVGAIADGVVYRVVKESKSGGWGNLVIVKHTMPNGKIFYSGYAHLANISVKENAKVNAGTTKLGMMGNTGYSTGAHLHLLIFTGSFSKNSLPKGYISKKITGDSIKTGGLTYYNPLKVISSQGTIIK